MKKCGKEMGDGTKSKKDNFFAKHEGVSQKSCIFAAEMIRDSDMATMMTKKATSVSRSKPAQKKKTNRTWQAMMKYQGAFTVIDPKFAL